MGAGGDAWSLSVCPGVGNRPPRKKKLANPRGYSRGDGYRPILTMYYRQVFTPKFSFRWLNNSHALTVDFIHLQSDRFWFQLCLNMVSDLSSDFVRHGPILVIRGITNYGCMRSADVFPVVASLPPEINFWRERSDDRKYVCRSQAKWSVTNC